MFCAYCFKSSEKASGLSGTAHSLVNGDMMVCVLPQPMDTAQHDSDMPLLLFCPNQGGWQIGVWLEGRWLDYASFSVTLDPTHWMPIPPDPVEA